jgi:hypothetical protein
MGSPASREALLLATSLPITCSNVHRGAPVSAELSLLGG